MNNKAERLGKKLAADASVKGSMSYEEIVKRDWKRNYEREGELTLNELRFFIKKHIDNGNGVLRLRNTLFLVYPANQDGSVKFHSLTGDIMPVYSSMLLNFLLRLNFARGVKTAYTYVLDPNTYMQMKPFFGNFAKFEEADKENPDSDAPYKVTIDINGFVQSLNNNSDINKG